MKRRELLIGLVCLLIVLTASSCCIRHEWADATCTVPRTCTKCGKTEGSALGHDIDPSNGQTVSEPSCTESGLGRYICSRCNEMIEEEIEPLGHSWRVSSIIREATCTQTGLVELSCDRCGQTEEQETSRLSHDYVDGVCSVCGSFEEISLYMSSDAKRTAESVHYISNRSIQEEDGCYTLLFGLENDSEEKVAVPVIVDIRIVNDDNQEVFRSHRALSEYDFGTWSNRISGSMLLASTEIEADSIKDGTSSSGTIYFTVYNPGYFSFPESDLSIYGLPYGLDSQEEITVNPYTFYDDMDNELRLESLYSGKWLEMQVRVESVSSDFDDSYYIYASSYSYWDSYYLMIYPDMEKVSKSQLASLETGQTITIRGFLGDGYIRGATIVE